MRHPLTDQYREGRDRLLTLGRSLSTEEGAIVSTACPAWTVKDLYAHLAGIATDILTGNTEGAATPVWADGHVAQRADRSLGDVLDEWATAGPEVSAAMETAGEMFPAPLFIDQWTHEWDIRAALGPVAAAEPDPGVIVHYLDQFAEGIGRDAAEAELDRLDLVVSAPSPTVIEVGAGPPVGEVTMSAFEFGRVSMGRRSRAQVAQLHWPIDDIDAHLGVIVRWSVNEIDVVDPVL